MKFTVTAQAVNPRTGNPLAAARDEVICTESNILFRKCATIPQVKAAYEEFWNGKPGGSNGREFVIVQAVKVGGY